MYYPNIKIGLLQDFGGDNETGFESDTFIPIFEVTPAVFFFDIKMNGYASKAFDGGIYFGYRQLLLEDQQLYGIYAAYDFKKIDNGDYFNQITFGVEYWLKHWFFGASAHNPIGILAKKNKKAVPGIDVEVGYEFSKKASAFLEGYYFNTSEAKKVPGVKVKFKYMLFKNEYPGVLDNITLEVGGQKDNLLGNKVFLSIDFKVGGTAKRSVGEGVAIHMTDPVFRSKGNFGIENIKQNTSENKSIWWKNNNEYIEVNCGYNLKSGEIASGHSDLCPTSYKESKIDPNKYYLVDQRRAYGPDNIVARIRVRY